MTAWAHRFAETHPVLIRRLRKAFRIWCWIAIPAAVLVLIFVPAARRSVGVYLGLFYILWQIAVLGRSRSLSFPAIMRMLSLGAMLAMPICLTELGISRLLGWGMGDDRAVVFIAGPVEETLKLAPLALFTLVAPNRVRRFGAVDFLLAGAAGGAGFQLVEDTTRRVTAEALQDPVSYSTTYTWHAWLSGWSDYGYIHFAGHAANTALIGAAIGLAVYWRRRSLRWIPPALAWIIVTVNHMHYNDDDGGTLPAILRLLDDLLGAGHPIRWLLFALLILAVIADYRAVYNAGDRVPALPTPGAPIRLPATDALVLDALLNAGATILRELRILLAAARTSPAAYYATTRFVRQRRELGYRITRAHGRPRRDTPPHAELLQGSHTLARLLATSTAVLVLLTAAALAAAAIGSDPHPAFLGGLFDSLAHWWNGLSPLSKGLVVVGAAAGLTLLGGEWIIPEIAFGDALGYAGDATAVAAHGHDIAAFIRNPQHATRNYFHTHTPTQIATDLTLNLLSRGRGDRFTHDVREAAGVHRIADHRHGDDLPIPHYHHGITKTDRLKEHLKPTDLDGARREAKGEVVVTKQRSGIPYNHIKEVRDAQQGLLNRIRRLTKQINDTRTPPSDLPALKAELREASRLLDHSERFLPRN